MMDRRWTVLRVARTRLNLTQVTLANLAGLSESKIGKFETFRQEPTHEELGRLAAALKVPMSELTDTDRIFGAEEAKGGPK